MPKITFIGAGSTIFLRHLLGDALLMPSLSNAEIALMDIDEQRLAESELVARRVVETLKAGASVTATTSRREALDGADFVIVSVQIGGYKPCTVTDFEIPKKYGLRQTIADTLGIGGIMRGLRTVPFLWDLCQDMSELCPDAVMLQYVNPMAINCWAIRERFPDIRTVGLCHSVPNTLFELTHDLDIPMEDVRYRVAGINHVAFFLNFEQRVEDGWRDLYPELRRQYAEGLIPKENPVRPRCPNLVRYEMMNQLGYFLTESSEHFAEYCPWFIKDGREDLIESYGIPLDEYPTRCEEQIAEWQDHFARLKGGEAMEIESSNEYAAVIMNAMVTGEAATIYGNVTNGGAISNLPSDCIVEVPCMVDSNGIQPTGIGALPPQLAAMMKTNINVQELTVAALTEENREHIFHAAMFDPHTAAELDVRQIRAMTEEMLAAHRDWLPGWTQ
ncbi:MAG: alpha-glucosidase/alpha-galactosidase [Pseudomonadota bacterium]|nr:alpha-glucosidase/alpha-galactosidase [Pseudomonadota bacterium]